MEQSRKHPLSPERSPNFGRYEGREKEDDDENLLERSIKKLKIDSGHVNVPFSKPMNKRFPAHIDAPDDPYYMHDINFPAVNKVLNELAIIREFREKVKKLKESKNMPPISEHEQDDSYHYHVEDIPESAMQPRPRTVLDFAPYHHEEVSHSSDSSSSGGGNLCGPPMLMPMDTE